MKFFCALQRKRGAAVLGIIFCLSSTLSLGAVEPISPVAATASSQSGSQQSPTRLVDNSGMDAGYLHDADSANMWRSLSGHGLNPRGGTVAGSHWVEFDLGQPYELSEMRIWNYNELDFTVLGVKNITIQYSLTGSTLAGDWTTIFTGSVPRAQALGQGPSSVDLVVPFNGVPARFIVLTVAAWPDHNYRSGTYGEVGLSEVRFYPEVGPQSCSEIIALGLNLLTDLNQDCRVDLLDFSLFSQYWMRCMDPTDLACEQPWAN